MNSRLRKSRSRPAPTGGQGCRVGAGRLRAFDSREFIRQGTHRRRGTPAAGIKRIAFTSGVSFARGSRRAKRSVLVREPHAEIYLHLVWATWDRLPLLTP